MLLPAGCGGGDDTFLPALAPTGGRLVDTTATEHSSVDLCSGKPVPAALDSEFTLTSGRAAQQAVTAGVATAVAAGWIVSADQHGVVQARAAGGAPQA
ncbi:MAG: hypothetical protein ACR2K2_04940 [Mycobacteriales bacterium]